MDQEATDADVTMPPSDPDATMPIGEVSSPPSGVAAPPGYEISGELGRGGMGVVYRARQIGLNRPCALKMILSGAHAGEAELARFRVEAEAIARLQHPNIVQVYEIGEHDGKPFFSLEFCAGGSLDRKLGGTPLEPREAAGLVRVLAKAVHGAHEKGVIHRDLKPANVLLGDGGIPKVTDFGLAKRLDDDSGATRTGAILGTPSYMAPEQAEAKKDVGPLADVYALGAILYDCLTGRPPFRAATAFDTILQVVGEEPVPPRALNAKVPRDLETITLKCLRKEVARRYGSAQEMADDLGRWLAGEPVVARPVGRAERALKWARRNKAVTALALAVVVALVGGAAASTYFALDAGAEAERASDEAERARAAEDAAKRRADSEAEARQAAQVQTAKATAELTRAEWLLYETNLAKAQRAALDGRADLADHQLNRCRWDFRGLEHDLLHTARQTADALVGVFPSARALALSPDGHAAYLTGGASREVRKVDLTTGRASIAFAGHAAPVEAVAALPGGRVASAGRDGAVFVWDADGGEPLRLAEKGPRVACLLALSDAELIGGRDDGTVTAWNPQTGKVLAEWKAHTSNVQHLAFAGWLNALITAGADGDRGMLRLWRRDAADWKKAFDIENLLPRIPGLAASAARGTLVTGNFHRGPTWFDNRPYVVFSLPNGNLRSRPPDGGHDGAMRCCEVTPDGRYVLSGGIHTDPSIRVWDAATLKQVRRVEGASALALRAMPDGRHAVYLSAAGELRVLEILPRTPPADAPPEGRPAAVNTIDSTADGRLCVVGHGDGAARLHDRTGARLRTFGGHKGGVRAAISAGGALVATGGADSVVRVRKSSDGAEVAALSGHDQSLRWLRFLPGGKLISADGKAVRVWEVASGREVAKVPAPSGVYEYDLAPDGSRFVAARSGDHKQSLTVHDIRDGRLLLSLVGHEAIGSSIFLRRVYGAAFSPQGDLIASAGEDGTVRLWGGDGKPLHTFYGHEKQALSVRFSPDGSRVLSAGVDGTVRVWGVAARAQLLELRPGGANLWGLHVAADGSAVFAGGLAGRLTRYDASAPRYLDRLELDSNRAVIGDVSIRSDAIAARGPNREALAAWSLASGQPTEWPGDGPGSADAAGKSVWANGVQPVYVLDRGRQARSDRQLGDRLRATHRPDPEWHLEQAFHALLRGRWPACFFHLRRLRG